MEEFPRRCGHEDRAVKETWEGHGPAKWRCDLARDGSHVGICMCIGTRKLQILGECSLLYLRRTGRQFQNDFPKPGCVPLMRWQVSYFGALLPKSWVSLFPAGSLLALSASAFREAARKLVNYFYSESTINKYLQTVCIFDKFHHTFNFKSKVSRDVFNNRNEYQLTSTIFSKLSSQCHMPSCRCHFDF